MLLDSLRQNANFIPYINTGTIFDIATGKFRAGVHSEWILDGGLSPCLGISGRGQTYKSGLAGSLLARALNIHKNAEAYVYESEGTIPGKSRYDDFVPEDQPVSGRIAFMNATDCSLTGFYDYFKQLVDNKIAHKNDYIVESPFLNPETNKPYKCWYPTFVLVDSFSRATADVGDMQIAKNSIDDTKLNTFYMLNGNIKSRIMNDLPSRASRAGVYVIMTAHVGDKIEMDPYSPTPKQLQYMKGTDRMKNVGSTFEFLTTALIQTIKAQVLQTNDKKCLYPSATSTDVEVNQVDAMLVRCKNNASGTMTPFVVSQYQGILNEVTNFNILRKYHNYGMTVKGNNQSFTPSFLDVTLTRTNIREKCLEYRVSRALEILAQMCYIQNLWSTFRMPEWIMTDPMKLAELFSHSKSLTVDRVLESTGNWSFDKQERERLSILDILQMLHTQVK
jgi:hypothetical protein